MGRNWAEALAELQHHWGSAYAIAHPGPGIWIAVRRDDHSTLSADGPERLLTLIRVDYAACPVGR